jgi:hypothetical protein
MGARERESEQAREGGKERVHKRESERVSERGEWLAAVDAHGQENIVDHAVSHVLALCVLKPTWHVHVGQFERLVSPDASQLEGLVNVGLCTQRRR